MNEKTLAEKPLSSLKNKWLSLRGHRRGDHGSIRVKLLDSTETEATVSPGIGLGEWVVASDRLFEQPLPPGVKGW